jgi:hypothetical protein
MRSMRVLCVPLTVALAITTVACSKSPDTIAKEARQAAASWGATLSAATEWWGSAEVPTSYVETIINQARTSLQKEEQTAPVKAVASHLDAIADAVKSGDRAAAVEAGHAAASEVPAEKTPAVARPE